MEDKSDKGTAFLLLPYPTYQFTLSTRVPVSA